ncbi:MAG: hypothetical protein ACOYD4_01820 [Solirubrobacterales bacterium]
MVLTGRLVESVEFDGGEPGFSIGDRETRADAIYRKGKKVGDRAVECVWIQIVPAAGGALKSATLQCNTGPTPASIRPRR